MIRAIIIDDEPLALEKIRRFAEREPDVSIVDSCFNGRNALVSIQRHQPDLLFLDIQMPGMTGFELLSHLPSSQLPGTIFITAYDEFALRAFEFHALDYLLKPFNRERFTASLSHARSILSSQKNSDDTQKQVRMMLESVRHPKADIERVIVKSNGRILVLNLADIEWMEAAGNYVQLHSGSETYLIRETMNALESRLPSAAFIRIHRSTIVNIAMIKELQPYFNGEYKVILKNNAQLMMSRGYRDRFVSVFGKPL